MTTPIGSFLLNKAGLRHFDYHWFWGLRYNELVQPNNLEVQLENFIGDEALLKSLDDQQLSTHQYHPFIVRFFFRLFNINNYAYNTYMLTALEACEAFSLFAPDKENKHESYFVMEKHQGYPPLQWARERMVDLLVSYNIIIKDVEVTVLEPIDELQNPAYITRQNDTSQEFIVSGGMLPHLTTLGLSTKIGDTLSWANIKHAYHQEARRHHPDKQGGSNERFKVLKAALDELEAILFNEQSSNLDLNQKWNDFFRSSINEIYNDIAEAYRDIAEVNRSIIKVKHTYDRINSTYDRINSTYDRINSTYDEMDIRSTKMEKDIQWMFQYLAQTSEQQLPLNESAIQLQTLNQTGHSSL